jgi:hypothetical protein
MVAEYALQVGNSLAALTSAQVAVGSAEMEKRMERLENSTAAFLESWATLSSWRLSTPDLESRIDRLSNALDIVRLGMLLRPSDYESHRSALTLASELAKDCHRSCLEVAEQLPSPTING